jgi:hypothetical protein
VEGSLNAGQSKRYLLRALQNQVMLLNLGSSSSKASVDIVGEDGSVPKALNGTASPDLIVLLPSSEDYVITVKAGSQAANYSLGITVPQRITFGAGEISATVTGHVSDHFQVTYLLRALQNQTMTVDLTPKDQTVGLTIYGFQDGQPLVRAEGGATSWTGKLPGTQDYVLVVVPAVDSTDFTLKITVK